MLVTDHFLYFKKTLQKIKASGSLVLIYFGRPQLRHKINRNCMTFQTVDPEICSILIFYNRVWD